MMMMMMMMMMIMMMMMMMMMLIMMMMMRQSIPVSFSCHSPCSPRPKILCLLMLFVFGVVLVVDCCAVPPGYGGVVLVVACCAFPPGYGEGGQLIPVSFSCHSLCPPTPKIFYLLVWLMFGVVLVVAPAPKILCLLVWFVLGMVLVVACFAFLPA